jgi:dolichol-phosphate mannosyltransferase
MLAYLTVVKIFGGEAIGDRPLLMLGILLVILGVQMISIGLIAEIVLHRTANRREANDLIGERTKTLEPADAVEPAPSAVAK